MSRDPTATSADLWPPLGRRNLQPVSVVHVLVVMSWVISSWCHCKQVAQVERRPASSSEQHPRARSEPTKLIMSPSSSLDRVYYDPPPYHQGQPQQQQSFNTRWPQVAYTMAQQKYITDLLRNQQQQLQMLQQQQQQHRNNKHWPGPSYHPIGSFYSLSNELEDDGPLDIQDAQFETQPVANGRPRRPFSNQLASSYQKQQPSAPSLTTNVNSLMSSAVDAIDENHKSPKLTQQSKSSFKGSSNPFTNDKQIHLIPVQSSYQYQPVKSPTPPPTTTITTTTTTTTPAPSSQAPEEHRANAIQIIGSPIVQTQSQRPKVAINLSSLIKPGEALLSSKETKKYTSDGPSLVRKTTNVVGVKDIANILKDLKPLALEERDKATGLESASMLPNDSPDAISAFDYDEQQEEEGERDNEQDDKLDRVLPTSHLFGGSVGLVSVAKLEPNSSQPEASESIIQQDDETDDQTTSFMKALKTLGSQLSDQDGPEQNYLGSASNREDAFYNRGRRLQANELKHRQQQQQQEARSPRPGVPIELLVDHLMSGSRLATRRGGGIFEHSSNPVDDAANTSENLMQNDDHHGQDDDDDEELEEDESDELPDDASGLATNESELRETRVLAPLSSGNNNETTWQPVNGAAKRFRGAASDARGLFSRPKVSVLMTNNSLSDGSSSDHVQGQGVMEPHSKRKRRRRSKKKRRSKDPNEEGLFIGKRKLSRLELIRLIKVLNRIANSKRPSKEREASRKLLRHLIKVAIENYKQSQERARLEDDEYRTSQRPRPPLANKSTKESHKSDKNDITDKRLRESLRSLLLEPTLGSSNESSGATKVSVMMQPWRVKSALIRAERHEGGVGNEQDDDVVKEPPSSLDDQADNDLKRPKTLVDISDDLERYFDTDFFEDLADKTNTSASSGAAVSPSIGRALGARRRAKTPAAATNVPMPVVLDAKQADEADEEDVDLDHIRVMPSSATTSGSGGAETAKDHQSSRKPKQPRRLGRPRRGREKQRRKTKPKKIATKAAAATTSEAKATKKYNRGQAKLNQTDDDDQEEEENENDGEHDNEPSKRAPEESRASRTSLGTEKSKRRRGREDVDSGSGQDGGGDKDVKNTDREQHDKETHDDATEADDEEDPGGDEDEQDASDERRATSRDKPGGKRRRNDRQSSDKKRSRGRRRLKSAQKQSEIRDRDEIPAPIVSGRMSKKGSASGTAKKSQSSNATSTKSVSPTRPKVANVTTTTKLASADKSKAKNNPQIGSAAKKVNTKQTKAKPDPTTKEGKQAKKPTKTIAKKPPPVEEVNYFNEGLEICEDGKCKLAMKSSHPKVKEHLDKKQPDKRDLAGQIDKWLQEEGSL